MTATLVNPPSPKLTWIGALGGLAIVILACALAYSLALPGTWFYDDGPSLRGLEQVTGFWSGLEYTLDGFTGPLGRPVALATFALQAEHWPENPAAFLSVNIAIHCLNSVLVFLISLAIGKIIAPQPYRLPWFALLVTALWAFSPFLASASLMVIQRMTTLSACFVFMGVLVYLQGRLISGRRPVAGLVLATIAVGLFTPLAVFTKENGALLPVLLLSIEWILVRPSREFAKIQALPRWWLGLALILPTALILAYLAQRGISAIGGGGGYGRRDFDLTERLLTQARIVWDYLFSLLLPRTSQVTPFMDGYAKSTGLLSPISTLWSVLALFATLASTPWLARRAPLLAFAIVWFLAAQLLESTVIGLELYFAHRVYVSAFAVFLAIGYLLILSKPAQEATGLCSLTAVGYTGALLGVLVSSASLWGEPDLAAEMWYLRDETSTRAGLSLANVYQAENDNLAADAVVQRLLRHHPNDQMLVVYSTQFCFGGENEKTERLETAVAALSPPEPITFPTALFFHLVSLQAAEIPCQHFGTEDLKTMIETAQAQPRRHVGPRVAVFLNYSLAQLAQQQGDFAAMRRALEAALELEADPQTVILIGFSHILEGRPDQGVNVLNRALENPPPGRLAQRRWQSEIQEYLSQIQPEE